MKRSLTSCFHVEIRRLVVFLAAVACVISTQGAYVRVSAAGGQKAGVVDNHGKKDKDKDKDKDKVKGPNRPNSVPEPASIGLFALGGAAAVWYRRRHCTGKQ